METQTSQLVYWHASERNPLYEDNLQVAKRESCHITYNVPTMNVYIKNPEPRRKIYFRQYDFSKLDEYGNPEFDFVNTDSNKQNACRMNKRLMDFASIVNVGWKQKAFSVVFLTLTYPEYNKGIRRFLKAYKRRLSDLGIPIYGYCWVLELGKKGSNPHYHVCYCVKRTKDLSFLFPDGLWKGRTKTEFVKKDCVRYMSKYLQKGSDLVQNWRRFGVSNLSSKIKNLK